MYAVPCTHELRELLQQAADATGINRTTIMRAIRSGKMSGTKDADGQWAVDVAEVARVYQLNDPCLDKTQLERIDQELAERVHQAERQVGELTATLNDMREQRDSWQREAHDWKAQAQSATKLLADQRPQPRRPWWWQRTGRSQFEISTQVFDLLRRR